MGGFCGFWFVLVIFSFYHVQNSWSQGIKWLSDEWDSWLDKTRICKDPSLVAAVNLVQAIGTQLHFDI